MIGELLLPLLGSIWGLRLDEQITGEDKVESVMSSQMLNLLHRALVGTSKLVSDLPTITPTAPENVTSVIIRGIPAKKAVVYFQNII